MKFAAAALIMALLLFPSAVQADQQPISGTPSWQNVPGLGEQYGYYWTDSSGNTDFIVADQSTGQPVSVYAEHTTAHTGYKTQTQTVTTTTETLVDVSGLHGVYYLYPANGTGGSIIQYGYNPGTLSPTPVLTPDPNEAGFGVFEFQNANQFPVTTQLTGIVPYSGVWQSGGVDASGDQVDTVTVPPGIWYFKVPLTYGGTAYAGQTEMFGPEGFENVVNSVQYNGQQYPVLSGGTAQFWAFYSDVDVSPYPGYAIQGYGNLVHVTPGFVSEQTFVPVADAYVGELQPQSVASPLANFYDVGMPSLTLENQFTGVTGKWVDVLKLVDSNTPPGVQWIWYHGAWYWLYPEWDWQGYIAATLTNTTPLIETLPSGFSAGFVGAVGPTTFFQGNANVPAGTVVPPNSTVSIELPISGTGNSPANGDGSYALGSAVQGTTLQDTPQFPSTTVTLTSPDGTTWAWWNMYPVYDPGGGYTSGDFRMYWGNWFSIGSPILNGGQYYDVPAATITLPNIEVDY